MRDNAWLEQKLTQIWKEYFLDVPITNQVYISFGRKARTRLGSIRQRRHSLIPKNSDTIITLTGYFRDLRVPEHIVDATIAHELCHYAHGFSSPLPQLSKYPHQGGIVDLELKKRGFEPHLKQQKVWLKKEWPKIIGIPKKTKIRKRRISTLDQLLRFIIS